MDAKTLLDSLRNELKRAELSAFSVEQLTSLNDICSAWAQKAQAELKQRDPKAEPEGWLARQNDFL